MTTDFNRIRQVAASDGYELAHGEESWGDKSGFGLLILVKMTERSVDRDKDGATFYKAAGQIKRDLQAASAALDPDGPALRESYRAEIARIYERAGVSTIYMEPLPNGYCAQPCCLNKPWFRVTSAIGHIVIGWRKSVISIDWKDTTIKASAEDLFPDEKVTRLETGIHAWGADKAAEYIRRLHVAATVARTA